MIPSFANLSHLQFGTSLGGALAKSLHGLCSSSYLKTSEHAISRCKSWPRNRGDVFLRSDRRRVIVRHPEINRFDVSRGKSMQRPLGTSAPLHVGIRHARIHERANAYVKKLISDRSPPLFLSLSSWPAFMVNVTRCNLLVCSKLHARGQCYNVTCISYVRNAINFFERCRALILTLEIKCLVLCVN